MFGQNHVGSLMKDELEAEDQGRAFGNSWEADGERERQRERARVKAGWRLVSGAVMWREGAGCKNGEEASKGALKFGEDLRPLADTRIRRKKTGRKKSQKSREASGEMNSRGHQGSLGKEKEQGTPPGRCRMGS